MNAENIFTCNKVNHLPNEFWNVVNELNAEDSCNVLNTKKRKERRKHV